MDMEQEENEAQENITSEGNKIRENITSEGNEIKENITVEEKKAEKQESGGAKKEPEEKESEDTFLKRLLLDAEGQEDRKNVYVEYRVIHNYGVMAGDNANIESIRIKESESARKEAQQKNILEDEEGLNNWLRENYESYSMALMLAVAVFDSLPYMWVIQAADMLYSSFHHSEDEKEPGYGITDILSRFGAEICQGEMNTYTGRMPIEVVHLINEDYQQKILKFIWKECPQLHDRMILWLKNYSTKKPRSMIKSAIKVMGLLACWDYYYFLNSMVQRIPRDRNVSTDMVIAQIVISLSKTETYQKNVYHLLQVWSREHGVHYLLTGLFVCVELDDKDTVLEDMIECYVSKALEEIKEGRIREYLKRIYDFFGAGMRTFTFYRILVETMYRRVQEYASQREKREMCELFLKLFAADIDLSRLKEGEDAVFIKLCMVNHAVSKKLCFLWQMVWQCRCYRQIFYELMAEYDMKISNAGAVHSVNRFVDKALGALCTEEMRSDICSKIHRRADNA